MQGKEQSQNSDSQWTSQQAENDCSTVVARNVAILTVVSSAVLVKNSLKTVADISINITMGCM